MYIAKELPLPRARRNLLFNPSELYSTEIDVLETSDGLIVKSKKTLSVNRKSGIKRTAGQSNCQRAK